MTETHFKNAPELWLPLFPFPDAKSHKYTRGTALIRGGEVMTGAARLAARAAQRMGAGLVTVGAPSLALPIYAGAMESVIVRVCDGIEQWQRLIDDPHEPALAIGPGLGRGASQKAEILATAAAHRPMVLDADGLTTFEGDAELLFQALHAACVLTPHEGEFARLFAFEGEKIDRVLRAAHKAGCIVLFKGAQTVIAAPDGRIVVNENAPPWLATAGAGDVLTGMIVGLLAQHMPPFEAAAAAAWAHGRAADIHGPGLIAEDIVAALPQVLKELS